MLPDPTGPGGGETRAQLECATDPELRVGTEQLWSAGAGPLGFQAGPVAAPRHHMVPPNAAHPTGATLRDESKRHQRRDASFKVCRRKVPAHAEGLRASGSGSGPDLTAKALRKGSSEDRIPSGAGPAGLMINHSGGTSVLLGSG